MENPLIEALIRILGAKEITKQQKQKPVSFQHKGKRADYKGTIIRGFEYIHYVELVNSKNESGWLHDKNIYWIAFETKDGLMLIEREALKKFIDNRILNHSIHIDSKDEYKKTRKQGQKSVFVKINLEEIKKKLKNSIEIL